ncbi:MAG: coproporphyrinogen III oxidase, partial [Methylococcales bacterium]
MTDPDIQSVESYLLGLQNSITASLEVEDGRARFEEDRWDYPDGGGGLTRILRDGVVFEQAGVNFSHVLSDKLPPAASASRPELA